jgi:hypothetical protein
MARPFKSGVDYFPLDVNIDEKVELLEAEHGVIGFAIWVKLLQKIYANNYWINWSNKSVIVFSSKINVNKNEVIAIINSCLEWEIFCKKLYDKHEILTSRGIQKRFFEITKRRNRVEVITDYLLIDTPANENIEIVNVDNNSINDSKSTQRKGKERKKKETYTDAFERWWSTYPQRNGRKVGKKEASCQFKKINKEQWNELKTATVNYSKECNGFPKDAERFLKNDFWKDYINKADNPKTGSMIV